VQSRLLRGACAATFVFCLSVPTPARADEPAALFEDGAELLSQARALWTDGTAAYRHGQLDRARLLYLSAWRAQHHWQIAGSLGHTEAALGRHRDAAEHLAVYLRETRDLPSVEPRDRALLTAELSRALGKVGVITVAAAPGAEVLVDGSVAGKAPLADPLFVDPGRHVVEVRLAGYRPATEARDLAPGGSAQINVKLAPAPAPPAATRIVMVPAPRPPAPRADRRILIAGGAATAALLGVGIGFTAWSNAAAHERDGLRSGCTGGDAGVCARYDGVEGRRFVAGNVAAWSFVGAGAFALATTTYAIVAPRWRPRARLSAWGAPDGAAASVTFDW